MQHKENMFQSKTFVDHLIFVLFSLTSCYKDLKLFSLEFAILVFLHFSQDHLPSSHPIANACLFLDVFIYKYTLLCCEQCVNVGLGKCVNVLMWV